MKSLGLLDNDCTLAEYFKTIESAFKRFGLLAVKGVLFRCKDSVACCFETAIIILLLTTLYRTTVCVRACVRARARACVYCVCQTYVHTCVHACVRTDLRVWVKSECDYVAETHAS